MKILEFMIYVELLATASIAITMKQKIYLETAVYFSQNKYITTIQKQTKPNDSYLSFKMGNPDWNLTDTKQLQHLPAVKWKIKHIQTLAEQNPSKHKI